MSVSCLLQLTLLQWLLLLVPHADAKPCAPRQLSALFQEAMGTINVCKSASEVTFDMPPARDLSVAERRSLCVEPKCKDMMGVLDDLAVPACDVIFLSRNLTLQATIDRFVSACDGPSAAPSAKTRMATPSPEATMHGDSAALSSRGSVVAATAAIGLALAMPLLLM
ncbi:hypothetical protein PINS_up013369 [Pythium insidiosum]|nr:hypothetical protein PINS_up013369 [Pythium insidiosum]